jgi:flagellar export protein FliJ
MFRFRFEALLRARRSAEEILQKELAEAQRQLAAEQAALRASRDRHRRHLREWNRFQQQGFHAAEVQLYERYRQRLEREIERIKKRAAAAERQMIQKRSALIDGVKKRKVLEKLKANDHQAHLNANALRERKCMDDVAARIFFTSTTPGGGCGKN